MIVGLACDKYPSCLHIVIVFFCNIYNGGILFSYVFPPHFIAVMKHILGMMSIDNIIHEYVLLMFLL